MADLKTIGETKMSEIFPWLEAPEVDAKYRKGEPGKTSDRWIAAPKFRACCKGAEREWHIEDGKSSQSQCYCPYWKRWINASLAACVRCEQGGWPDVELYRNHLLPGLDKEVQEDAVLEAVAEGTLSEKDAIDLGKEYDFDSAQVG